MLVEYIVVTIVMYISNTIEKKNDPIRGVCIMPLTRLAVRAGGGTAFQWHAQRERSDHAVEYR